jgi:hypothetical protein
MKLQLQPKERGDGLLDTIGLQPMELQFQPNLPGKEAHSCHWTTAEIETPSAKARWYLGVASRLLG